MSDNGIRVKVLPKEELEKRYYLPSKRELKTLLQDAGFLPPDAEELAQSAHNAFLATPEGRLACVYPVFYVDEKLRFRLFRVFLEEEGRIFYANEKLRQDDLPITGFSPRSKRKSNTIVLTSGLENLLASYVMTERSFVAAVPHAGVAVKHSNVLSQLLRNDEIKRVVLAFPKSQAAYQHKLAKLLKQDGFQVEELDYEGKSPFHHYQLSVARMMEQAMEQLEHEEVYNPAREA